MYTNYQDIINKAGEPLWYDDNRVPRYTEFVMKAPYPMANIYCNEVALVETECQGCGHKFIMVITSDVATKEYMANRIKSGYLPVGDPPNIDCCLYGPTLQAVPKKVLQFWSFATLKWVRHPELETELIAAYPTPKEDYV